MAKKKKKQKEVEEKYEFVPPEFNEKQFLKDEMANSKRVVAIILYGVVFGVLAALATATTKNGYIGFVLFLVGLFFIRYFLFTARFDLSKFTKKTWVESMGYYFFTSMAIWILVINPPFIDYIEPEIKNIRMTIDVDGTAIVYNYSFETETWHTAPHNMSVDDAMWIAYNRSSAVNVSAQIADSSGLRGLPVITFSVWSNKIFNMTQVGNNLFYSRIEHMSEAYLGAGGYMFTFGISAGDNSNNQANFWLPLTAEISVLYGG